MVAAPAKYAKLLRPLPLPSRHAPSSASHPLLHVTCTATPEEQNKLNRHGDFICSPELSSIPGPSSPTKVAQIVARTISIIDPIIQHMAAVSVSFKQIPPSLRPVVRAYLLGYGAAVVPQTLSLVLKHVKRLGRTRKGSPQDIRHQRESFFRALIRIFTSSLDPRGLAVFCAALAAGPSFFQVSFVFTCLSSKPMQLLTFIKGTSL